MALTCISGGKECCGCMKCLEGKQVEKDDSKGRGNTRIFDPADEGGREQQRAQRAAELIGKDACSVSIRERRMGRNRS